MLDQVESQLLQAIRSILTNTRIQELLDLIGIVIEEDISFQSNALSQKHQRCYAVKVGYNGLLDVARQIYKESNDDVNKLKNEYIDQYGFEIELKYSDAAGFQFSVNQNLETEAQQSNEFLNFTKRGKNLIFTSVRLVFTLIIEYAYCIDCV